MNLYSFILSFVIMQQQLSAQDVLFKVPTNPYGGENAQVSNSPVTIIPQIPAYPKTFMSLTHNPVYLKRIY